MKGLFYYGQNVDVKDYKIQKWRELENVRYFMISAINEWSLISRKRNRSIKKTYNILIMY